MSLANAHVESRLPAQDLDRARRWYAEKLGLEPVEEREGGLRYECGGGVFCLFASTGSSDGTFTQMGFFVDDIEAEMAEMRSRGVVFEEYGIPGLPMVDGIVDIPGNYPSKGRGERGAWFRDSEGNLIGLGQAIP
jgi:catechol 2,3-dioxygenase-like lactoylglutathione lyase family enzyme